MIHPFLLVLNSTLQIEFSLFFNYSQINFFQFEVATESNEGNSNKITHKTFSLGGGESYLPW